MNKFFQKDIYLRIVLSYLAIFALIFLIGLYTYFITYKISVKNLNRYTTSLLNHLSLRVYDEIVKPLDLIQQSINRNPFYLSLFLNSDPLTNKNEIIFEIRDFCNTLKLYYTNPFITEIGVYIPKDNIIISPAFFESAELFFRYFVTPISINQREWLKLLSSSNYNYFSPPITFNLNKYIGNNRKDCIVYLHSLDNWQFDGANAKLFILIDKDKLAEYLKDISLYKESNIFILNPKGEILVSYAPNSELFLTVSKLNFKEDNINVISEINYKKKNWKCFYTIDQNAWKYIVFIPSSSFFSSLSYFRVYFILFFLISTLVGVPLIIILSQKSYHPVDEIKKILFKKINIHTNSKTCPENCSHSFNKKESIMLKEIAQILLREEEKLKQQLTSMLPIVQNSFIENLLKGNILLLNKEEYEKYQINFISDTFCVILIEICNINKISEELSLKHDLLRVIVFNVFDEVLSTDNSKCFNVILSANILAIVLNIGSNNLNITDIIKNLEHAKSFLEQNFCLYITVGLSSIKTGIESISDCYYEAETALNYKFISGNLKVNAFENLPNQYYRRKNVYVPPEIENKIYNAIFEGNKFLVENLLELIYERNIKKSEITTIEAKVLCIQLVVIFENACRLINYTPSEDLINYLEKTVISHINNETIQDFFYKIKQMFAQLAQYVEKNNLSLNRRVSIEKIIEYINKNYSDPNLSLVSIADEFKVTPQYLSLFFKEMTGQKLSDYIINLRIEKAKYLLINSTLSISEISQHVGYNYPTNFINAFKKRVGISPAKFRIISNENQKI